MAVAVSPNVPAPCTKTTLSAQSPAYRQAAATVAVAQFAGHTTASGNSLGTRKIAVPGARDAVRTVNIRYEVTNGLRFFDEHDELYWNVTGTEWPVPIRAASARIVLPEGVSGVRHTAYTGHYGSITPTNTVPRGNSYCRDFTQTIYVEGRSETATGTACRNPDGTWSIVDQ